MRCSSTQQRQAGAAARARLLARQTPPPMRCSSTQQPTQPHITHYRLQAQQAAATRIAKRCWQESQRAHVCRHGKLLHQRLPREVQQQRVVRGQRHGQPARKVRRERIAMVVQEQRVVAQRAHAEADLREVVQVLQEGALAELDAMRDVLGAHEARGEVVDLAGLAAVRPQRKGVEATRLPACMVVAGRWVVWSGWQHATSWGSQCASGSAARAHNSSAQVHARAAHTVARRWAHDMVGTKHALLDDECKLWNMASCTS